ncbi:MAG: NAD-dependent epimerase/dehydratase family protein [Methanobrevibacter sp.]|uniref:NAD-dependent epimerase/dehydratase family protein n=1 Tax=Methanobrevibacter sp. TaxID=66852 RepID=UPI0025F7CEA3|nr:NAD-dependent epimerase/dehydratase family protein [Methanobrevibacter sp.]MBQ6099354.1 NAD-dependent epimerase/dehydratase family protein [Methanobrevibacter sp.]
MKSQNILITGGLGFIGSHIANNLLEDNRITIIDNLSSGNLNYLNDYNHENLTIIKSNLDKVNLNKCLNDIDYVFHLSAMVSVPLSMEHPIKCHDENVSNTINLLDACVKNDIKKIIFSSSSAVYGDNSNLPLNENEPPNPASPYAASKACCELYLKSFYESYNLNYVSLRYFNVFGPKQDKNSPYAAVIPNFINALLKNKSPVIYGDGEQTRDFVYVGDVAKANIKAAESDFNGIVNVASGKRISINYLYKIIKNTLNSEIEAEYLPERPGDIKHSHADISNMTKIGFEVCTDNFENQLIETINWFKLIL